MAVAPSLVASGLGVFLLAGLILPACGDSAELDAYDGVVADAQQCAAGETCVVAGGVLPCRCPIAVRATVAAEVDEAAEAATCEQAYERSYCPPLENARCEQGSCVGDLVEE